MKPRSTVFLSILLLILIFLSSGQSFTLLGYKWPKNTFRYYINPQNRDVPQEEAVTAIKNGARVWKPWIRASFAGTTVRKRIKNDGTNNVFFRSSEYGALASTYIFSKEEQILDVDIVFWDEPWKFYSGKNGCEEGYFITDVATHEFGHAIGIGHTQRKAATMFARCGVCNNAVRSLELDDAHAASRLYGTVETTTFVVNPK